jgi:undecaprenyl-phosphate 4-deoxy-4-formamido-L-arabinose transferase
MEIRAVPAISVVIPVYRAEQTIQKLYRELADTLPAIAPIFEIIFVEDGGGDGSWTLIDAITQTDPRVRGIRMSRNYGQHNALLAGIRAARHELIVTMDDDLQHPVSEIQPMLNALDPDHDVVYGVPQSKQHSLSRTVASQLVRIALAGAIGGNIARHVSAFRVFRTGLRNGFAEFRSPYVSIDVLLSWSTARFTAVPVQHVARTAGKSGYSWRRLIRTAIDLAIGFNVFPLRLASLIGFLSVVFGLAILFFVLVNFLIHGSAVPGFAFLASMIAIFSGAQMFTLGIFGEYFARMYFRSIDRPPYVIAEVSDGTTGEGDDV